MSNYISVKEASQILKCTRQEVVRKIWRGFIKAEKVGKIYIIPKTEITRLKREQKNK
jgi:excisionase family DNA binding protein